MAVGRWSIRRAQRFLKRGASAEVTVTLVERIMAARLATGVEAHADMSAQQRLRAALLFIEENADQSLVRCVLGSMELSYKEVAEKRRADLNDGQRKAEDRWLVEERLYIVQRFLRRNGVLRQRREEQRETASKSYARLGEGLSRRDELTTSRLIALLGQRAALLDKQGRVESASKDRNAIVLLRRGWQWEDITAAVFISALPPLGGDGPAVGKISAGIQALCPTVRTRGLAISSVIDCLAERAGIFEGLGCAEEASWDRQDIFWLTQGRGGDVGLPVFYAPSSSGNKGWEGISNMTALIEAEWPNEARNITRSADVQLRRRMRAERRDIDDMATAASLSIGELKALASVVWEGRKVRPMESVGGVLQRALAGRLSLSQCVWAIFCLTLFLSSGDVAAAGVLKQFRPSFSSLRLLLALVGATVAPGLPLWNQWKMAISMMYDARLVGQALNILEGERGKKPAVIHPPQQSRGGVSEASGANLWWEGLPPRRKADIWRSETRVG